MWQTILAWLKSGDWEPTFDGIAAIVVGLIAYFAVIRQIRASERQVREQLANERAAATAELDRRAKALAIALVAEINDFYQFSLRGLYGRMKGWFPEESVTGVSTFPEFGALPSIAFTVYKSTAQDLGILNLRSVRSVIQLYGSMTSFVDLYDGYRKAWQASSGTGIDRIMLQDIWDNLPKLILDSYETCALLATKQRVPFDKSEFQIAGLDGGEKQLLKEEAGRITERLRRDMKASTYRLDS